MIEVQELNATDPHWPPRVIGVSKLNVVGDPSLLQRDLIGFLCSRQCPGRAIRAAFEAIIALRSVTEGVVGGCHSPIEQECLELLVRRDTPIVHCVARSLSKTRFGAKQRSAIERSRLTIVSVEPLGTIRTTKLSAERRNALVSALCERLVVPHASPGGLVERLCFARLASGERVDVLDSSCRSLLDRGALLVEDGILGSNP